MATNLSGPISRRIAFARAAALAGLAGGLAACGGEAAPAAPTKAPAAAGAAAAPTVAPTAAAAATKPAAAPTTAPAAAAGGGFDWKKYKGESLSVLLVTSPRADVLTKNQKEFEDLTGIKVEADVVPEQQQRQKTVIEFTSGNPSFDITQISLHVQKSLIGKGKWMLDLNPLLKDATMTDPELAFSDFGKPSVDYSTQADGRMDTMPNNLDFWILYYNKELFEKKGLKPPQTHDEMVAAAKAIHDPKGGVYGFAARGLKNANVPVWTGLLHGWGADTLDPKDMSLKTTTEEAIAAATLYKELLSKYSPEGVVGFNWNECQTAFMQGTVGLWYDGVGFATPLEDATKSKVVGKVGYILTPKGPKAQHAAMFGDGIGITNATKKKGPAWLYLQWATNKVNQARLLSSGGGSPARQSAYTSADATKNLTVPKEWFDTLVASTKVGRPGLPQIIPVTEFRDIFGVGLTNMISGADPKAELTKATEEFKPVLEKSLKD
jgi:multiple sugar transport system substrate-binding protein